MVGTVVKEKVGGLEGDIREGFSRSLRKERTGVVQEVVGKKSYSVRFQDRGEGGYMSSNQLTTVVVGGEVEEEIEVREVEMIPEVGEDLGCYHWDCISIHFIKEDGIDKREDQLGVKPDPDDQDIEDVVINNEREHHWRMVFEDNNGGVDGKKALLHAKRRYVYNS